MNTDITMEQSCIDEELIDIATNDMMSTLDTSEASETEDTASEEIQSDDTSDTVSQELETLRAQVNELTELLARKQDEAERISAQIGEFYSLFPETTINALPDEVWENVKNGNSLAASYAIYQRKMYLQEQRIKSVNQKNASLSAGKAGVNSSSEFFTPDEVRAMSREQVRTNYNKIMRSMQKWN